MQSPPWQKRLPGAFVLKEIPLVRRLGFLDGRIVFVQPSIGLRSAAHVGKQCTDGCNNDGDDGNLRNHAFVFFRHCYCGHHGRLAQHAPAYARGPRLREIRLLTSQVPSWRT